MHEVEPRLACEQHLAGVRQVALEPETVDSALSNVARLAARRYVTPAVHLDRDAPPDAQYAGAKVKEKAVSIDPPLAVHGLPGEVLHRFETHDRVERAVRLVILPSRNLGREVLGGI